MFPLFAGWVTTNFLVGFFVCLVCFVLCWFFCNDSFGGKGYLYCFGEVSVF